VAAVLATYSDLDLVHSSASCC